MKKRGQFYLVAAIIIVVIVMSLVVVTNYSTKQEYTDLNSLADEIQIEAANTLDYSVNLGESDSQTINRMQNFSQEYINLESGSKDIYFIFGTPSNITINGYQKNPHTISLNGSIVTNDRGFFVGSVNPGADATNLKIDSNTYNFKLGDGQSFYFVLSKDIGGGNYVVTR